MCWRLIWQHLEFNKGWELHSFLASMAFCLSRAVQGLVETPAKRPSHIQKLISAWVTVRLLTFIHICLTFQTSRLEMRAAEKDQECVCYQQPREKSIKRRMAVDLLKWCEAAAQASPCPQSKQVLYIPICVTHATAEKSRQDPKVLVCKLSLHFCWREVTLWHTRVPKVAGLNCVILVSSPLLVFVCLFFL